MNTEKMIPISYVKQFTPLVKGDELFYKDGGYKFTLKSKVNAALYNNNDETVDKYYSLVSFVARENTGKQPVADDVIVDVVYSTGYPSGEHPDYFNWELHIANAITSWKPNHAALLAKFKEQGANTMNTRQYDDQETELATHFSGNNNRFYIRGHSTVKKAMVLNNDGHWIYSDCTRNDELDGGEFWKLDGKQVLSEDWVIDHLTDKPVFTQEMAKHRQAAPIGSSVQTSTGEGVVVAHGVSYGRSQIVVQTNETMLSLDDSQYYPIDSRTDEERAVDDLIEIMQSDEHSYSEIIGLIKAGKIHGVKWIIE